MVKTVCECYEVARSEANRYQAKATRAKSRTEHECYIHKRDAASRIARLIRFGRQHVERNR